MQSALGGHRLNALRLNAGVEVRAADALASMAMTAGCELSSLAVATGEALMGMRVDASGSLAINGSASGLSEMFVRATGDLPINDSAQGVSAITVLPSGDLLVSDGSGGISLIRVQAEGSGTLPAVNAEGMAAVTFLPVANGAVSASSAGTAGITFTATIDGETFRGVMSPSALGGHTLNALRLNASVEIRAPDAVASATFAGQCELSPLAAQTGEAVLGIDPFAMGDVLISDGSSGASVVRLPAQGDGSLSSSVDGGAAGVRAWAEGSLNVFDSVSGLGSIRLEAEGSGTLPAVIADGLATMMFLPSMDVSASESSAGIAGTAFTAMFSGELFRGFDGMSPSALGGHALNTLRLNANSEVRTPDAIADMAVQAECELSPLTAWVGEATLGIAPFTTGDLVVSEGSNGTAAVTIAPTLAESVSVGSDGRAIAAFTATFAEVVSSGSAGVSPMVLAAQMEVAVSSSSAGTGAISAFALGDMEATTDRILFGDGEAAMTITGTVSRLALPAIPAEYAPAKASRILAAHDESRFTMVSPAPRRRDVSRDRAAMLVGKGERDMRMPRGRRSITVSRTERET